MRLLPFSILLALILAGCASTQSARYPVDTMLDPVTEEVPRVILP